MLTNDYFFSFTNVSLSLWRDNVFVFEDHHRFSTKDLDEILTFVKAAKASNLSLVTTEKDMVRLLTMAEHPIFESLGIFYIPIKFEVDTEEESKNLLFKVIEENKNLH